MPGNYSESQKICLKFLGIMFCTLLYLAISKRDFFSSVVLVSLFDWVLCFLFLYLRNSLHLCYIMCIYNFFVYCTNLLIVLGHHAAVKIDPKVSLLLHFTNFLLKIRLPHLVQAKLNLNRLSSVWIAFIDTGWRWLFIRALLLLKALLTFLYKQR